MRALVVSFALIALVACKAPAKPRELDYDMIRVTNDARLRTDAIGDGKWTDLATFVLVEAENTAKEGAYVTLAGDLVDEAGATVGSFKPQSLYIPGGELRTFALIDQQHKPRPSARGAKIFVRGARVGIPPAAHVDGVRTIPDGNRIIAQGTLKNDADRAGNIVVIATFYAPDGKPMTRPFSLLWVEAKGELPVQFVGPPGSTRATIFLGDAVY
jgi:hypothetical protein